MTIIRFRMKMAVCFVLACLACAGPVRAGSYGHGVYTDKNDGFSIAVPASWEKQITSGETANTYTFISPDKQVGVGVSVFHHPGGKSDEQLLVAFQRDGFAGAQLIQTVSTTLNGYPGLLKAYRLPNNGDPIIAGAFGFTKYGKGYVVWHMILHRLYNQRFPESDALMNTFKVFPAARRIPQKSSKPSGNAVPDFFGSMDSQGNTVPQEQAQQQAGTNKVPDFFGGMDDTGSSAAQKQQVASPAATPAKAPVAHDTDMVDVSRFPLWANYSLNNIPDSLAARPNPTDFMIPLHDDISKRTGGGTTILEYKKDGRIVGVFTFAGSKMKSIKIWKPDGRGFINVKFWGNGMVSNVNYWEDMHKQGVWRFWDEDGSLAQITTYKDNREEGLHLSWYRGSDDFLRRVETRAGGKRDGVFQTYHQNGQIEEDSMYELGTMIRQKLYYSSGELRADMRNEGGRQVGKHYKKNGSVSRTYD